MPISPTHKALMREHFRKLLGDTCVNCGSTFNIEIHHIIPCGLGRSRGSERRIWDLFAAYHDNNLRLLCHDCHVEHHKAEREAKKHEGAACRN